MSKKGFFGKFTSEKKVLVISFLTYFTWFLSIFQPIFIFLYFLTPEKNYLFVLASKSRIFHYGLKNVPGLKLFTFPLTRSSTSSLSLSCFAMPIR